MNIQYENGGKVARCGGYKFNRDEASGYYRSSRATDIGRAELLHRYVYRKEYGEIPDGCHIHHIDGNKSNNAPENLKCLNSADHLSYHTTERHKANHDWTIKNLDLKARPAASVWHGSKEGREWHSKMAKETANRRKKETFVCEYCGKLFESNNVGRNKFCGNACKAAARRKSGVDNEIRACTICGSKYSVNRYSKSRTCSPTCRNLLRWREIKGVTI